MTKYECIRVPRQGGCPPAPCVELATLSPHRLSGFDGQRRSGHPGPGFRTSSLNAANCHAIALPDAGTPLAAGSTTTSGSPAAGRPARSGTASGSSLHRMSRTPSATRFAPRGRVPRRHRRQQGAPALQTPGQAGHHHRRPVAHEIVHRRGRRRHASHGRGNQVFLIATAVGREHGLLSRSLAVVGDGEEVAILLEQPHLSPAEVPGGRSWGRGCAGRPRHRDRLRHDAATRGVRSVFRRRGSRCHREQVRGHDRPVRSACWRPSSWAGHTRGSPDSGGVGGFSGCVAGASCGDE
jgi:hypothetical protein